MAITAYVIKGYASWWVGTAAMLPFVAVGGFLIVRKIRRWDLVLSFLIAALATVALRNWGRLVMSTSLIFFAAIMITEPLTAPPTRRLRIIYIDTEVQGHVDQVRMAREIPDYRERTFYISGSHGVITAFEDVLKQLKIPKRQIVLTNRYLTYIKV